MSGRKSKNNCCVVGCNATYKNTSEKIQFYRFPKRKYEVEKCKQWVNAINRQNADGSLWEPSSHSRICSKHFVGNRKSNIATNPSYIPSIFPDVPKERYELLKRHRLKKISFAYEKKYEQNIESKVMPKKDFGCQVFLNYKEHAENELILECLRMPNGICTQVSSYGEELPFNYQNEFEIFAWKSQDEIETYSTDCEEYEYLEDEYME